jgi:LPXTG-site transpeptidase (sortase) family protein
MKLSLRWYALLWGSGTVLVGVAVFWALYIVISGQWATIFRYNQTALPDISLTYDAQAFQSSLPVLNDQDMRVAVASAPHMVIPRLGVNVPLVDLLATENGWDVSHLDSYIGHLAGTDLPGGMGNTAFAGHLSLSDDSPGPLSGLESLQPGDDVVIYGNGKSYQYQVSEQQLVGEDRVDILFQTPVPTLTLITCARWSWLDGHYTGRQVVIATLLSVANAVQ